MEVTGGLRGLVKAYILHIVVFQLLILSQSRTVWNFAKYFWFASGINLI